MPEADAANARPSSTRAESHELLDASLTRLMPHTITSPVFVCRDNIDTDQIIPAQYLTLVPTIAEEYEKLGSYAMIGLPDDQYPERVRAAGRD